MKSAAIRLTVAGTTHTFTTDGQAKQFIRDLHARVNEGTSDLWGRRCALGFAINQAKDQLRYGHIHQLYGDLGISPRRAQEVRRFADLCGDPLTGTLDHERFSAWRSERTRLKRDKARRPSISRTKCAESRAFGSGNDHPPAEGFDPAAPGAVAVRVPGSSAVLAALEGLAPASRRDRPAPTTTSTTRPAPSGRITQPDLPWHLAETAARLPALAQAVQARVADGRIPAERAHDLQDRIDALHAELIELGGAA